MSPRPPYVVIVASVAGGSIQRRYELPLDPDEIDRQAFLRWFLDVAPAFATRNASGPVEFWREDLQRVP